MDKIKVMGKSNLFGSVDIGGSKNASLPILVSSLLNKNDLILKNTPELEDTKSMIKLLSSFGVLVKKKNNKLILNALKLKNNIADYDLVRKMRASILVLGPLLTRFNKVKISLPGGCAIGTRPIDIHLEALSKLGVKFNIENGFVIGEIKDHLRGAGITLPFPSVGATENLIMAATFAKGNTIIKKPAKEPEIIDLCNALNKMGAKIIGHGSSCIKIQGVNYLNKSEHTIMFDRIVAGTFVIAGVMLNKKFIINNIVPEYLKSLTNVLKKMKANLIINSESITVLPSKKIIGTVLQTAPYPGFPTDLQAQIMALMCLANNSSKIIEKIFENRFMHVAELNRLGANIKIKNDTAFIEGNTNFKGAQVMASDLRASVSLVLAALCAEGETIINRVYHLDRGYEKIEKTLGKCGVNIIREK
ncbi:UDP-N-acetylglucosamine 1-carboxyvinyltransferase [Alphaproteobacteria bacterium]|nr:UDP-N-acetylglucosamine 1-carboxyvinyltransferase [Alphaproteobacteria bacterium]